MIATPFTSKENLAQPRIVTAALLFLLSSVPATTQTPGIGQRPYLGWSSASQQSVSSSFLTQANIAAQSDALQSSGLETHGFTYINIDSGWQGSFDSNGRPLPDTSRFPDIQALIRHIHSNGQQVGITWSPGVPQAAVSSNAQILDTMYHLKDILAVPYVIGNTLSTPSGSASSSTTPAGSQAQTSTSLVSTRCVSTSNCVASVTTSSLPNYKIDYTKSGAQEYVSSIVDMFASWGMDAITLDGVGPATLNESVDNQADVAAWGTAITQNGRPIWFTVSSALDQDYLPTWERYANARRIGGNLECTGSCPIITNWPLSSQKLYDLVSWQNTAGSLTGWNDLGPLVVGNSATDGLSPTEQQSMVTFWAMANAPMYLGGDLTTLDQVSQQLLTNDEVIEVDQSGRPAEQVVGGMTPVWVAKEEDGSFDVALFNLNAFPSPISIDWNTIGFLTSPNVRDLWSHSDLGGFDQGFTTVVLGHGARLLKVQSKGLVAPTIAQHYEAEFGLAQGSTQFSACKLCSDGNKVAKLGLGTENTLTLNNVYAERAGTYRVEIAPVASGQNNLIFQVNDGEPQALKVSGGSSNQPSSSFLPLQLKTGYNSIQFGNASGVAPDLDRISVVSGSLVGSPFDRSYEAELAGLSGTETASSCPMCSGGAQVSSIEQNDENAITFSNVNVPSSGVYELEIDYVTASQHSLLLTINGGKEINIDLTGSSSAMPSSTVVPVVLKGGKNELRFTSHDFDAPALDRIAVAPPLGANSLVTSLITQNGPKNDRVWTLQITNSGYQTALNPQIDILALTQSSGKDTCQPKVLSALPLIAGSIPKHGELAVPVHLDFSKCSDDAQFNTLIVYSASSGAIVADSVGVSVVQQ